MGGSKRNGTGEEILKKSVDLINHHTIILSMEKKARILVVDDEEAVRELISEAMMTEGFQVDVASNGREAVEFVRNNIYDVAIIDFNLPDMDGLTLHHQVKVMDKELADNSIFISGLIQKKDHLDYFYTQSAGFLPKPFRIKDLLFAVNKILEP
jgi:DNA-binding response OmpR family regulator